MARVLPLILVFALLGCPLCCHWGKCCAESGHRIASGCCSCCSRHECPPPAPSQDCPPCGHEQCQGICGGAVLAKPFELADPHSAACQALPAAVVNTQTDLPAYVECANDPVTVLSGRMLRQMHQSLLC